MSGNDFGKMFEGLFFFAIIGVIVGVIAAIIGIIWLCGHIHISFH